LKIKAFYDQSFKRKFGSESTRVIRKVISHAQNHFYWPSLTTKIKLILVYMYVGNAREGEGEGERERVFPVITFIPIVDRQEILP
jgi:hypothetical protein